MDVLCQIPENCVHYNATKTQDIRGETAQIPKNKTIFQSVFAWEAFFISLKRASKSSFTKGVYDFHTDSESSLLVLGSWW
jgi:hypothetical protein